MAVKEEGSGKTGGGWFKAILGTVGGLVSGAVVMYFSAWVDKAVKPAKPVPNFRVEHEGRTVHFQDLSPGFTGWWDFGDGTELVPADGAHQSLDHKYERPGDYTVKLSLSNLLGEENDRTVALHVEDPPDGKQPRVVSLTAERVTPGQYAPAVYKLTAKTENARMCIWDMGDKRAPEVVTDGTAVQEKLATFDKARSYTVRLMAVNDTLADSQSVAVTLQDAPPGAVTVEVTDTDAGTKVTARTVPCCFGETFRPDLKGDACPLSGRDMCAASGADKGKGWIIKDVQLTGANGKPVSMGDKMQMPLDAASLGLPNARNLQLKLANDRSSIRLTGELTRPAAKTGAAWPCMLLQGTMIEELMTPATQTTPLPAMMMTPAAGRTTSEVISLPAVPADWIDPQPRMLRLAVRDGLAVVAHDVPVPGKVDVTVQQRRCTLSATLVKDQVHLDLTAH
jgi:hypothetical protein